MKNISVISLVAVIAVSMGSCTKDKTNTPVQTVTTVTRTKEITVNFSSTSAFTFFSFKDTAVVANADSASAKWDFALRLTTFLVNSNSSGPGNAGVVVADGIYDNIIVAPLTGYSYDTSAAQRAIKDGSWYDYNSATHSFSPKAGKVFIFKTADGLHYAKMEILSVDYLPFTGPVPQQLVYKIRFTFQADGSGNF